MPDTSVQHSKSFDDNLDILFDEIMLAEQWGRPSLLLAVHKSRFGQEKAEAQLEDRLRAEGFHVQRIAFNDQRSDIALLLNEAQSSTKPVYYISNLDWGGGDDQRDAYRGLNLHREMFVEGAVRAVFWLTANEAANLPRYAPDFWAFRHRVVEFISQRATGKVRLPAGILVWDVQQSLSAFESTEASIRAREELLRKLPDSPEALAARVELHAGLGFLHWCLGSLSKAADELQAGLVLAGEHALPELKASLLNGLGIIRYEMGDFGAALDKFQEGLRFRSSSRASGSMPARRTA
jgi:tetratricopeptide (TPR) repeat protein